MDWDRNGTISRTEFKSYLQEMKKGEEINMEEVMRAFKNMDKNQDNQISWDEFYVSDDLIRHSSSKFLTYAKYSSELASPSQRTQISEQCT